MVAVGHSVESIPMPEVRDKHCPCVFVGPISVAVVASRLSVRVDRLRRCESVVRAGRDDWLASRAGM